MVGASDNSGWARFIVTGGRPDGLHRPADPGPPQGPDRVRQAGRAEPARARRTRRHGLHPGPHPGRRERARRHGSRWHTKRRRPGRGLPGGRRRRPGARGRHGGQGPGARHRAARPQLPGLPQRPVQVAGVRPRHPAAADGRPGRHRTAERRAGHRGPVGGPGAGHRRQHADDHRQRVHDRRPSTWSTTWSRTRTPRSSACSWRRSATRSSSPAAAEKADRAGKPIVAVKVGSSPIGQAAALAHTGSVAGDDAVVDAVLRQLNVIRVNGIEELLTTGALLGYNRWPAGRRIGIVTASGGGVRHHLPTPAARRASRCPTSPPRRSPRSSRTCRRSPTAHNPLDVTGYGLANAPTRDAHLDGLRARGRHRRSRAWTSSCSAASTCPTPRRRTSRWRR